MQNGNLLLDTSIVVRHFRGERSITEKLEAAEYLYLPTVVLGELYHGAFKSSQRERQLQFIRDLLPAVTVLGIGKDTAEHFGHISAELAIAGTPIPQNDLWVAALAREYQLPIATGDSHFDRVREITILRW